MIAKRLTPAAIVALREALARAYWYKGDMHRFILSTIPECHLLPRIDWNSKKVESAGRLIDLLCTDQERYLGDLTRLCYALVGITSFRHLEQLEDGTQKAAQAKAAIDHLRELLTPHDDLKKEAEAVEKRRHQFAAKMQEQSATRTKLAELNARFLALASSNEDPQRRGIALEQFMYDLFALFDLDPKAAFRITGEQIDGAFSLDGTDYLFEAKWHQGAIGTADLSVFKAKVDDKLENTLGLFLSMNGFSAEGIERHSQGRPKIILMDGADLMAVLEQRIDFLSLLQRKKRHASRTGIIYFPYSQFASAAAASE